MTTHTTTTAAATRPTLDERGRELLFTGARTHHCNLGYGDASKLHPRAPRLSFEEACSII
jgi:hypothetical protein